MWDVCIPMLQWNYDRGAGAVVYATSEHLPVGVTAGAAHPHRYNDATPAIRYISRWFHLPVDADELSRRLWPFDPEPEPWEVPSDPSFYYESRYNFIPPFQWAWHMGYDWQPRVTSVRPPVGVTSGAADPSGCGHHTPATGSHCQDDDEPVDAQILSELLWRDKRPAPEDWDPDDPDGEAWEVAIDPRLYYGSSYQDYYDRYALPRLEWVQYVGDDGQEYTTSVRPPAGLTGGAPAPWGPPRHAPTPVYSMDDQLPIDWHAVSEQLWHVLISRWDGDDPDGESCEVDTDPSLYRLLFRAPGGIPRLRWRYRISKDWQLSYGTVRPRAGVTAGSVPEWSTVPSHTPATGYSSPSDYFLHQPVDSRHLEVRLWKTLRDQCPEQAYYWLRQRGPSLHTIRP